MTMMMIMMMMMLTMMMMMVMMMMLLLMMMMMMIPLPSMGLRRDARAHRNAALPRARPHSARQAGRRAERGCCSPLCGMEASSKPFEALLVAD